MTVPIIAIDGPSGVGKGSLTLYLAQQLNWHVLDSGAIYRVLAYAAMQQQLPASYSQSLVNLATDLALEFQASKNEIHILLHKQVITKQVRTELCADFASKIAVIPEVRQALLQRQRDFAITPGLIADGRDMASIVFPQAQLKLFLTASTQERAQRRYKQLKQQGINVSIKQVVDDITARDERDIKRAIAPLKPVADSLIIDTTDLSIQEVQQQALALARNLI
jgi:CMP/dCMP kinase